MKKFKELSLEEMIVLRGGNGTGNPPQHDFKKDDGNNTTEGIDDPYEGWYDNMGRYSPGSEWYEDAYNSL